MSFLLEQGARYRANIHLSFPKSLASNDQVKEKLEEAGFVNVVVTGEGNDRIAEGMWPGPRTMGELPEPVTHVERIDVPPTNPPPGGTPPGGEPPAGMHVETAPAPDWKKVLARSVPGLFLLLGGFATLVYMKKG